jgi:hypothetical protein
VIGAPAFVAAWLSLPLMAAPSTSLDLAARTEARVRIPGDQGLDTKAEPSSYDWEMGATSNLLIDFRDTKIQVGYTPRFSFNDFTHQAVRNLWQTGAFGITWLWPRVQLSLTETGAYGDRYFSALSNVSSADPATGSVVLQALPRSTSVRDVNSDTALKSSLAMTRRTSLNFLLGYQLGGGIGAESRTIVPFFTASRALASVDYKLTLHDTVSTLVQGLYTRTSSPIPPEIRVFVGKAGETWQRQWAKGTSTTFGAGAAVIPAYALNDSLQVRPTGLANVTQAFSAGPDHGQVQLGAGGGVDVVVDRLTGIADTRAQIGANGAWTLQKWTFSSQITHARSLTAQPNSLALTTGEVRVSLHLTKPITLDSAVRILQQRALDPIAGTPPLVAAGFQWGALVAFSYHFDLVEL